jgi:superfamily I DNA/RNA helicase
MRDGEPPQVHHFSSVEDERDFVVSEIGTLIEKGMLANEIGILHDKKHVLNNYRARVPRGVQMHELKRQTGLEYKAVFVPQVQQLFERTLGMDWEEDKARNLLQGYMTMTRARDYLYMLYCQQWPNLLEPVRPYVEWVEH